MELFFRGGTEYWFHEFHHDHGDDGKPDEFDRINRNIASAIGNDLRTHGGEHGNRPRIEWLPSQDIIENPEDASHEKPVDRRHPDATVMECVSDDPGTPVHIAVGKLPQTLGEALAERLRFIWPEIPRDRVTEDESKSMKVVGIAVAMKFLDTKQ